MILDDTSLGVSALSREEAEASEERNSFDGRTLLHRLGSAATTHPQRTAFRFLGTGGAVADAVEEEISYAELRDRVEAQARVLIDRGARGERVLVLLPPGLEYVVALLSCFAAGAVAVPAYPPRHRRTLPRLRAVVEDAEARFVIADDAAQRRAEGLAPGLSWWTPGELDNAVRELSAAGEAASSGHGGNRDLVPVGDALELPDAEDLAFLQYTSGSTGRPKGVMLRHRHLMANQRMIRQAFGTGADDVVVSWLPLYHDMGLIGGVFHPLFLGASCVLMAPQPFLQRPLRWLEAVQQWGGTVSGAPDFAYDLCVHKTTPEQREELDLSRWRVAFNGAEPVRAATLSRFAEAFAPAGFAPRAFRPCYGLAEATLLVTGGPSPSAAEGAAVVRVDAAALEAHRVELDAPEGDGGRDLVSSGVGGVDRELVIVDIDSLAADAPTPVPSGRVGEVWVAGPAVADGYWRRPEATEVTFGAHLADGQGPFLRTGDLGFIGESGDLFVTGRHKDLIILRGRNLYPQDIEASVESSHPSLRSGGAAAFAIEGAGGAESLAVVAELELRRGADHEAVLGALRRRVAEDHEAAVTMAALLRPGALPRTSSGKVRRRAARQGLLDGSLETQARWRIEDDGGPLGFGADGAHRGRLPAPGLESQVATLWSQVLGVGEVAATDTFFQLGGDSLTATELVGRIGEDLGLVVDLDALFDHPTVEELAAYLKELQDVEASGADVLDIPEAPSGSLAAKVPSGSADGTSPLSFPQRRLWFLHQLEPANPVHHVAAEVDLEGPLDVAAWGRALTTVVARHDALRTAFETPAEAGEPRQRPWSPERFAALGWRPLPVVDLTAMPASRRSAVAADLARACARRPFDLERPPLLRGLLLQLAPRRGRLVLAVHHIACDGWSLGLLFDDWLAAYRGARRPPLIHGYDDFARRQRAALPPSDADLDALRHRLQSVQATELPTDHPRPPVLSHRGAHWVMPLPEASAQRWTDLASGRRATPFMAYLTIFAGLLERWTDRKDALVGTPVAGREDPAWADVVGCFINLLPLPLASFEERDHETTGLEALDAVRRDAAAAYRHRRLPFERLVEALAARRDPSRTPIFQILFVQQNAPMTAVHLPRLTVSPRELDLGTARFDLAVNIARTDDGPVAIWKYSTDLYDAATIQRLARGYRRLLEGAARQPEMPLAALPLLSEAEHHQLRLEHNDTAGALSAPPGVAGSVDELTLHGLLEAAAIAHPEVVALVDVDDTEITYRQLLARCCRLAHRLAAAGARPERAVGVLLHREAARVEALFAVLLAGSAYVPLSFEYPASRRELLVREAGLQVVVTRRSLADEVPEGVRPIFVDDPVSLVDEGVDQGQGDAPSGEAILRDPPLPVVPADSLAYIIYTSGTTGRPKGVMVSHRAAVNRILWTQSHFPLAPGEGVLHKTPFGFDVSVWELFWPAAAAATMVVAEDGRHGDTAYLARRIAQRRVTTVHFVPSMLQAFVEEPAVAHCTDLKRVIASGEALTGDLASRFATTVGPLTGARLHNLYGPTEAAVDVTFEAASTDAVAAATRATVPIGLPVANTTVDLLDAFFRLAPLGAAGEIVLGGVQLARGYRRNPALTAERFRPDPWAGRGGRPDGARVYRTGDLARRLADSLSGAGLATASVTTASATTSSANAASANTSSASTAMSLAGAASTGGSVEYLGRLDHQVKVRGVRIELGEVRAALVGLAAVRDGEVLARPGSTGALELVAYAVPEADAAVSDVTPEALAEALGQRLPGPMVPGAYGSVDTLPLTPNGKVDRRALAALPVVRPHARSGSANADAVAGGPPSTPLERHLSQLWREVLELPPEHPAPGPGDDFFALGGDSVRGALMINRLQGNLNETLYVMTLFDAPRLGALARHLAERFPAAVARWVGVAASPATVTGAVLAKGADEQDLERVAAAVVARWRLDEGAELQAGVGAGASIPPAATRPLLILSPFRSGSTLLRVMLAGHPALFSPPELELLHFATLEQRARAFDGRDAFSGEGLTRALMELHQLAAPGARRLERQWLEEGLSVAEVYRRLEAAAGGRRLVDKTPSYALSPATLERAETYFHEPTYIHLLRHPRAVIHSYVRASMDQVYRFGPPPRRQAEACWALAQRNILELRRRVPAQRWVELCFEDLVADPEAAMGPLCEALGLDFHPALLDPYGDGRMTDGLAGGGDGDRMMGDPRFHRHRRIEAAVAHRWQRGSEGPTGELPALGESATVLAASLGYGAAPMPEVSPAADGGWREAPLGPSQERLWFLSRLLPRASVAYHMPARLRLRGHLHPQALAAAFGDLADRHPALRTALPERRGRAVQRIAPAGSPPARPPLPVVDLSGVLAPLGRTEAQRLGTRFARRPFDLARGPLLRLALLRFGEGDGMEGSEPKPLHHLLVGLHHVAADGWSLGLVVRELGEFYSARVSRRSPDASSTADLADSIADPLPPVELHFADFARWQRRWVRGPEAAAQLAAWKERLEGAPAALELPSDRPRPAVASYRGGRRHGAWSAALRGAVEACARQHRTTPFAVLAAAFGALLARLAGDASEVVLGSPVAGRGDERQEAVVGCFVNTVPLRLAAPPEASFSALVAAAAAVVVDALGRQRLPFESLVEELAPERSLARAPLFQVLLVLQNQPMPKLRLPRLELSTEELPTGAAKLDLTLSVAPPRDTRDDSPGRWEATLEYAVDLFDGTTVARWLASLERLLTAAAAAPETAVGALPLASVAETHQLLIETNDTHTAAIHQGLDPHAETLPQLVAAGLAMAAARAPEAPVLVDDASGESLTADQLRARVAALAAALRRAAAVGPETRVAVALPRSADLVVALLAVVRCGAAYVPLDPDQPRERLAWLAEDSAAAVVVAYDDGAGEVGAAPVVDPRSALTVRADASSPISLAPVSLAPVLLAPADPDRRHPAYVLYTSGSTGRPKGVAVPHEGIVNRLRWMQTAFPLGPGDAVLQKTPMGFDVSVWEFFWAFAAGARLVIARPGGHRDPRYLADVMERRGVTVAHFVPSMLELFLEPAELTPPSRLRQLVASGEALPPELARRCARRLPGVALANLYGPTEASVDVTWHRCRRRPVAVPIGRPVHNTRVALLRRDGRDTAPGAAGELALGGVQLARGYHRRPRLTAASFVPDPWAGTPLGGPAGARLYRTGDLARLVPGGELEYLGRVDFQVKVRGVRVELGEVEGALRRLPEVREAVVILRRDAADASGAGGGERLAAYVTLEEDSPGDDEATSTEAAVSRELRQRLARDLPEAMVPAAVEVLETLPLSSNGKVDRKALAALPATWRQRATVTEAPRGDGERRVAALWCELLGLDAVGPEESFFDVGGHSLLAMRLRARLEEDFGRTVAAVDLFQHPTVRTQAALLARDEEVENTFDDTQSAVVGALSDAPLSPPATAPPGAGEGKASKATDPTEAVDPQEARRRRRQRLKEKAGSHV